MLSVWVKSGDEEEQTSMKSGLLPAKMQSMVKIKAARPIINGINAEKRMMGNFCYTVGYSQGRCYIIHCKKVKKKKRGNHKTKKYTSS